ncbi:MAG: hypothetical protein Q8K97_15920 [Pseudohongiella sp.]|nr:hypothetical protein [Pseudohongiella sp.]
MSWLVLWMLPAPGAPGHSSGRRLRRLIVLRSCPDAPEASATAVVAAHHEGIH